MFLSLGPSPQSRHPCAGVTLPSLCGLASSWSARLPLDRVSSRFLASSSLFSFCGDPFHAAHFFDSSVSDVIGRCPVVGAENVARLTARLQPHPQPAAPCAPSSPPSCSVSTVPRISYHLLPPPPTLWPGACVLAELGYRQSSWF